MRVQINIIQWVLICVCVSATACGTKQQSAESSIVRDDVVLFEAGQNGYEQCRIPAIAITPKGTILTFCEARKRISDWADIDIFMRRSTDGGDTWEPPVNLVDGSGDYRSNSVALRNNGQSDEITVNNPVPIVDVQTGQLHFLYCIEYAQCYYMSSIDEGKTFTDPVEITDTFEQFRSEYDWKVIATGPGHGIQLENGRLIVPVWLSTGTGGGAHRPSIVSTIFSDDHGKTWHRGDVVATTTEMAPNPSETLVLELADGRVMLNIRNESKRNRRLVAVSPDGATNWSEPEFDEDLFEPICMASLIRLSKTPESDKNRILFANPDSRNADPFTPGSVYYPRQNITLRMSYDEGQTWPVFKVLETGKSGYSDLAVGPEGWIYCFFEQGVAGDRDTHTARLTVARFTLGWLTDGQDTVQ
jgi:sialidase-1